MPQKKESRKFFTHETIITIFTGVIAVWTIIYSVITGLQLVSMKTNAEIDQRAYLSAKNPITIGGGYGLLKIPIENYGHVPCKWFTVHLNYLRMSTNFETGKTKYIDNRIIDFTENNPIYPGNNSHQITILTPRKSTAPKKLTKDQSILIRAKITYDTGFNSTDEIMICETFKHGTGWESCGGLSTDIDLDDAKVINSYNK